MDLREIVEWLKPRCRYAEVRYTDENVETVRVRARRDGRNDAVSQSRARGIGIRVLGEKTWGFACTPRLDADSIEECAQRALDLAASASRVGKRTVMLPERAPQKGSYRTKIETDPFSIPLEERIAFLDAPARALLKGRIHSAELHADASRLEKRLVTTDGVDVEQIFHFGACNMQAIAVDDAGNTESRTAPTWSGCDAFQGGWERVVALDLLGQTEQLRSEAEALLDAPYCPEGELDLILESSQVALQVHESCGHPTELDRVFGTEITLAGGSFLDAEKRGSFRYGSDLVTITADSVAEGGPGTFGWDDEGTPAGTHPLVERGTFVDFLSSRETAAVIGRSSTGTMRASGFDRVPLVRMTNVSLAPGRGSLEDLIADTKHGVYMLNDRSWSIDDQRLDFQFSCELGWEIVNGKRARLVKRPLYGGSTPKFWASCDAICGPEEYRLWGISSCGKGDPMQLMAVGHGAAPARFRDVKVGRA